MHTPLSLKVIRPLFVLSTTQKYSDHTLREGTYRVHIRENPFPEDLKNSADAPYWWVIETENGTYGMTPTAWIGQNVNGNPSVRFQPEDEEVICDLIHPDLVYRDSESGKKRVTFRIDGFASLPHEMCISS